MNKEGQSRTASSIESVKVKNEKNNTGRINFSLKNLLSKLNGINPFKNRNGKIILLSFLLIGVIFAYYYFNHKSKSSSESIKTTNSYYTSSLDYSKEIERKLTNVLKNVSGAGKVSVMVTLSSSLEIVYAENIDEKNNSTISETSTTSSINTSQNTILVKNNGANMPLIVKEILPEIKGVVVVSEGAKDVNVKLKIIQAIKALLDIPSSNIQVLY